MSPPRGVPINNIVFVKPSTTLWSDAGEHDIEGYSNNGLAWRWRIPSAWHRKITLKLIEFLESAVTIYTTILQMGQGSHILAFTDSSSVHGWIHKESFDPVNAASHDGLAHWLGWKLVSNKKYLYSQHIKGTENIIVDYLSRDLHRSDQTIEKFFNRILPPQKAA